jgi:hypothetical protein
MRHDIGTALTTCRVGLHSWSSPSLTVNDVIRRTCRRCDAVVTAPRRPRSIRIAWSLLVAIVVLGIADIVVGLLAQQRFDPAAVEFRSTSLVLRDRVLAELSSSLSYAALSGAAAVVVLVPLVIALRRPRAWARVSVWIALSVYVPIQGLFIAANPTLFAEPDTSASGRDRLLWDNLVPDWYEPATHLIEVPLVLASVAVIVLLLFDTSHEYFAHRLQVATDDPRIWRLPRRTDLDDPPRHPRSARGSTS